MHKTCLFLYTPDKCYDIMKDAEAKFMDYDTQCCSGDNWHEILGIVHTDGRCSVEKGWQEQYGTDPKKRYLSLDDLRLCALRDLLEEFKIKYSPDDNFDYLHELFNIQAPTILSQIYSGSEMPDYRRRELANLYEYYNRSGVYPFTQYWTSPYDYNFFDLRPERFDDDRCNVISEDDAVMVVDIHC